MTPTVRPTKKQRVLLDFIEQFITQHGYSPSYREIVDGCNYNSVATVAVHINNLISRGHLRKRDHSARSLELTASANQLAVTNDAQVDETSESDDVAHDAAGPQWLIGQVESAMRRAEAGLGSLSAQTGQAISVTVPDEALLAYNEVQMLMATLTILEVDGLGEVDGRNFAARLRAMEATVAAATAPKHGQADVPGGDT